MTASTEQAMPNLAAISRTLAQFAASDRTFQIIHTIPPSLAGRPTSTLYILDSSFNPPTLAHLGMCLSAIRNDRKKTQDERKGVKRLLLLLATKNADKPAVPAAFDQRLAMMGCLAEDLRRALKEGMEKTKREGNEESLEQEDAGKGDALKAEQTSDSGDADVIIDVGVTKEALFVAKARAIEQSGAYASANSLKSGVIEQVHLTGFDSLIRLVDAKYYPDKSLGSLKELFDSHRVVVTMREPPPKAEQVHFYKGLEGGSQWEAKGWENEWCGKIELVEGYDKQVG